MFATILFCLLPINVKIKILKIIILSVDLGGYETWSITLREGHRLRVFLRTRCSGEYLELRGRK
jgi:hypothetical protein